MSRCGPCGSAEGGAREEEIRRDAVDEYIVEGRHVRPSRNRNIEVPVRGRERSEIRVSGANAPVPREEEANVRTIPHAKVLDPQDMVALTVAQNLSHSACKMEIVYANPGPAGKDDCEAARRRGVRPGLEKQRGKGPGSPNTEGHQKSEHYDPAFREPHVTADVIVQE